MLIKLPFQDSFHGPVTRVAKGISPGAGHGASDSTIVYISTGSSPLQLCKVETPDVFPRLVGIWWETDWMGMGTKEITFPVTIPANQRAMIQINHIVEGQVILEVNGRPVVLPVSDGRQDPRLKKYCGADPANHMPEGKADAAIPRVEMDGKPIEMGKQVRVEEEE